MNCNFINNPNGQKKYICSKCGRQVDTPITINCGKPNIAKRTQNFAKATIKHIRTGMKHCTPEQRDKRFKICQSNKCGRFHNGICNHDDCGCFIRNNGKFMDKLSWAESKCPEGYWGPIAEKDGKNT